MRRAFFSKRGFWVYGLALIPSIIFFGHAIEMKVRRDRYSARSIVSPQLIDTAAKGEAVETVLQRLGKPSQDDSWESRKRIRAKGEVTGVTTHEIEAVDTRIVRLNIARPTTQRSATASGTGWR